MPYPQHLPSITLTDRATISTPTSCPTIEEHQRERYAGGCRPTDVYGLARRGGCRHVRRDLPAEQLACVRPRQLVQEHDLLGRLRRAEPLPSPLTQRIEIEVCPRGGHDSGRQALAPLLVG